MNAYYEQRRDEQETINLQHIAARYDAHFHKGIEIICAEEDGVEIALNAENCVMKAHSVLVVGSYDVHQILSDKRQLRLILPPQSLRNYDAFCRGRMLLCPYIPPEVATEIHKMVEAFSRWASFGELELQGMIDQLLGACARICGLGERVQSAEVETARRLLIYLEENYKRELTLSMVAAELNYSKYHLSHVLAATVHTGFSEYLNRLRLKKFEHLMRNSPVGNVLDAAFRVGFQSVPTFYRVYRRQKGRTPGEFVKSIKNGDASLDIK